MDRREHGNSEARSNVFALSAIGFRLGLEERKFATRDSESGVKQNLRLRENIVD
jgi:hypothetical protein